MERLSAERVGGIVSRRLAALLAGGPPRLRRKPWTAREIGQRVWGRVRPPIRVRRALGFST